MVAVRKRQPARTLGSLKEKGEENDAVDEVGCNGGLLMTCRRSSRASCGGILLAISKFEEGMWMMMMIIIVMNLLFCQEGKGAVGREPGALFSARGTYLFHQRYVPTYALT
jgi:hypothetical protein